MPDGRWVVRVGSDVDVDVDEWLRVPDERVERMPLWRGCG
jgi:hypothetical protein